MTPTFEAHREDHRLANSRRGSARIPSSLDISALADAGLLHRAYTLFGEAVLSGDVAALRRFLDAATGVSELHRPLVRDLLIYAACLCGHRAVPDDGRKFGRDVCITNMPGDFFNEIFFEAHVNAPGWNLIRGIAINRTTAWNKSECLKDSFHFRMFNSQ